MLVTNLVWKKNIVLATGIGLDVGALRHPGLVVVSAVNLWLGRLDVVSRFCWGSSDLWTVSTIAEISVLISGAHWHCRPGLVLDNKTMWGSLLCKEWTLCITNLLYQNKAYFIGFHCIFTFKVKWNLKICKLSLEERIVKVFSLLSPLVVRWTYNACMIQYLISEPVLRYTCMRRHLSQNH